MTRHKVFYSWQSDLPNATNRGFIQTALERAARSICDDDSIEVEPVVDRDTFGIPGAPDISGTIFEKIEAAEVFVCDISIVSSGDELRPTPNPNVLIELGYAVRVLGWSRVIMVMNTALRDPDLLPFDLRGRRVVTYTMPEENQDRATERRRLQSILDEALRLIFVDLSPAEELDSAPSLVDQVCAAVESGQPTQALLTRRFMVWVSDEIAALTPVRAEDRQPDELLVEAIAGSTELVEKYGRVTQIIAHLNRDRAAEEIYEGFGPIIEGFEPKRGNLLSTDLHKFLGHELFVVFFSFLVREGCWELIASLLESRIFVRNTAYGRAGTLPYYVVSSWPVALLEHRNSRLNLRRISLRADLLNERHTEGDLGGIVPMRQFVDAEFFLLLRAELHNRTNDSHWFWKPWSLMHMDYVPQYLAEASSRTFAQQLLRPLGVRDVQTLRHLLEEQLPRFRTLFEERYDPFRYFDPASIGTQ